MKLWGWGRDLAGLVLCAGVAVTAAAELKQFPPSELTTLSGKPARPTAFSEAESCGACHDAHVKDWKGSLHHRAHADGIYTAFAELARREGGDQLYLFCSSCHASAAVATGEIPGRTAGKHTFLTNEGVTCDVCHFTKDVRAVHLGAGANASLVLDEADVRYGPLKNPATNDAHRSVFSETHTTSHLCSACHTLTHPYNGMVIENTYGEWKHGPYAKAGIQCQDCHMRTVAQALTVAATLKPIAVPGRACDDGPQRPDTHAHTFVGASTARELNGSGALHAAEAGQRLKTAAKLAIRLPARTKAGGAAQVCVDVTNLAAGHAIPSSVTELRQVWIEVQVHDATGHELWRSGGLRANGSVDPSATMFHSVLGDAEGRVTYLPWKAVRMLSEKLLPPRETVTTTYAVPVPAGVRGPLAIRATLRYRSAPQEVMDELFGTGKFKLPVVDMATAGDALPLE